MFLDDRVELLFVPDGVLRRARILLVMLEQINHSLEVGGEHFHFIFEIDPLLLELNVVIFENLQLVWHLESAVFLGLGELPLEYRRSMVVVGVRPPWSITE